MKGSRPPVPSKIRHRGSEGRERIGCHWMDIWIPRIAGWGVCQFSGRPSKRTTATFPVQSHTCKGTLFGGFKRKPKGWAPKKDTQMESAINNNWFRTLLFPLTLGASCNWLFLSPCLVCLWFSSCFPFIFGLQVGGHLFPPRGFPLVYQPSRRSWRPTWTCPSPWWATLGP